MQTNMETFGKRCPYYIKWKVLKTRQTFLQFGNIVENIITECSNKNKEYVFVIKSRPEYPKMPN